MTSSGRLPIRCRSIRAAAEMRRSELPVWSGAGRALRPQRRGSRDGRRGTRRPGSAAMPAEDGRTVPSEQTTAKDQRSTSAGWPSWPPSDQPKLLDVDMQGWSLYAVSSDDEEQEDEPADGRG